MEREVLVGLTKDPVLLDLDGAMAEVELNVSLAQDAFEFGLRAAVVRGEQPGGVGDEVEGQAQIGSALRAEEALEAVLRGQGEFDAAGASAHHHDLKLGLPRREGEGDEPVPTLEETVDRFDRQRELGGAGNIQEARR